MASSFSVWKGHKVNDQKNDGVVAESAEWLPLLFNITYRGHPDKKRKKGQSGPIYWSLFTDTLAADKYQYPKDDFDGQALKCWTYEVSPVILKEMLAAF